MTSKIFIPKGTVGLSEMSDFWEMKEEILHYLESVVSGLPETETEEAIRKDLILDIKLIGKKGR